VLFDDSKGGKYSMVTANAADLDLDGDIDLVLGDTSGAVFAVRNEGTPKEPKFVARASLLVGEQPLRVCHKSDAIPVDWNGDGVLDLLVGDETSDVSFFAGRKDGTYDTGVSLFSRLPVDPKDKYAQAKAKLDPHRVIPGYRVRLAVADWNDDGKLDLLIGNCDKAAAGDGGKGGATIGHVYVLLRQ
jgi:hypothetical protein